MSMLNEIADSSSTTENSGRESKTKANRAHDRRLSRAIGTNDEIHFRTRKEFSRRVGYEILETHAYDGADIEPTSWMSACHDKVN